jgi:hypothetical protein
MKNSMIAKLVLIALFNAAILQAQEAKETKISLMQGVWESNDNSESEKSFTIIKGMNALSIVHSDNPSEMDFPISESVQGFQNKNHDEADSINVKTLKEDGRYFTTVDKENINKNGWVEEPYFTIPTYFEIDKTTMSINGGKIAEFTKIKNLPAFTLKQLYKRGQLDKRNYLKDYLNIDAREIIAPKSIIFQSPGTATKMYLVKGDLVSVISQQGEWVKVEYQGKKIVQGWIKKEHIK